MVQRLRKTKKNQKYDYSRNRKRMVQKSRRNGSIRCPEIRAAYDRTKLPARNIREMGLAYNVNRAIPVPNVKKQILDMEKALAGGKQTTKKRPAQPAPKQHVADELEQQANEFAGTRFRMARSMVRIITGMIDRHGFNYQAMARDRTNYEQETWRQYRAKVRRFLRIPEQCTPYLERKGWVDCDMSDPNDPRWKEFCTDDEA
ncbi:nucleolar protein 16 [Anopheles stephensi]|uniref:Nucleolar protein 16 n=1 Tax=Anopheles stephensi TaxID=30069 RepID=A0A182Y8X8_ANOST|nr:nucleolar protein 16 [Anopheles stephensi]XP_035899201.1 nucleolar protein 16 [Anopheles stephensi]